MKKLLVLTALLLSACTPGSGDSDFRIEITSMHEDYPLVAGVYAIHERDFTMNIADQIAHDNLRPLIHDGNTTELAAHLANQEGVLQVFTVDEPLTKDQVFTKEVDVPFKEHGVYISSYHKIGNVPDSYAYTLGLGFYLSDDITPYDSQSMMQNYDLGTKEPDGTFTAPQAKVRKDQVVNMTVGGIHLIPLD